MKEKFILSIIVQFSTTIIGIICNYFFALFISIELRGIWVLILSIVNLSFLFTDLGIDAIHFQYSGKSNFEDYFGSFLFLKLLLLLINIIIDIILFQIFNLWNSPYIHYIIILLIAQIFYAINLILISNLRAHLKIFKIEIPNFIITTGKNLLILYTSFNLPSITDPILFIGISFMGFEIIYLGIILFLSKKDFKLTKVRKEYVLSYLRDSKLLVISAFLVLFTGNIGNLILDFSFGHESLANFSIIYNFLIYPLIIISTSVYSLFLIIYANLFEKNDLSAIKNIVRTTEKYFSIFFLTIIPIIFLNCELLFSILFQKYLPAVPIAYILIILPYFFGIAKPYSYLLLASKKQKLFAFCDMINHTLTIVFLLIFIPESFFEIKMLGLGVYGYALALIIPRIITSILHYYFSYKYFKILPQKEIILHFILAIIALGLGFLLKEYLLNTIISNQIILFFLSSAIILTLFLAELVLFNQIKTADLKFIYELITIKNYMKSLKEEF